MNLTIEQKVKTSDMVTVKKIIAFMRRPVEDAKPGQNMMMAIALGLLVALIALFIATTPADANEVMLSPHFKLSEFNQRRNPLPLDQIKVDPKLVKKLEELRARIGKPIKICSGYRSPRYNEKVGGAKHSQHMDGKAADILVAGMTAKELEPIAKEVGFTFTQTYTKLPHLHVDVR